MENMESIEPINWEITEGDIFKAKQNRFFLNYFSLSAIVFIFLIYSQYIIINIAGREFYRVVISFSVLAICLIFLKWFFYRVKNYNRNWPIVLYYKLDNEGISFRKAKDGSESSISWDGVKGIISDPNYLREAIRNFLGKRIFIVDINGNAHHILLPYKKDNEVKIRKEIKKALIIKAKNNIG